MEPGEEEAQKSHQHVAFLDLAGELQVEQVNIYSGNQWLPITNQVAVKLCKQWWCTAFNPNTGGGRDRQISVSSNLYLSISIRPSKNDPKEVDLRQILLKYKELLSLGFTIKMRQ